MLVDADKEQVSVSHYDLPIPPIKYINENGLPFCEGNVVKYISRYKRKNGYDDLVKCAHYVLLTMQREDYISADMVSRIMQILKAEENKALSE